MKMHWENINENETSCSIPQTEAAWYGEKVLSSRSEDLGSIDLALGSYYLYDPKKLTLFIYSFTHSFIQVIVYLLREGMMNL